MNAADIAHQRLLRQHIARPAFKKPAEVVKWLCAVQAQDYAAAEWALGSRNLSRGAASRCERTRLGRRDASAGRRSP